MTNPIVTRVLGVLLFLAGIPLTIWLIWLSRTDGTIDYHFLILGSTVTVLGLVMAIRGRTGLRNADGTSRGRMTVVSLFFILGNFLTLHVARERDFPPLENLLASFAQKAPPPEHLVTREEVDAAIKEVNERAAELQKVRATLNTGDAAAVKKFDLDVAAYTERNHAVAALQAKFTAAQARK